MIGFRTYFEVEVTVFPQRLDVAYEQKYKLMISPSFRTEQQEGCSCHQLTWKRLLEDEV